MDTTIIQIQYEDDHFKQKIRFFKLCLLANVVDNDLNRR